MSVERGREKKREIRKLRGESWVQIKILMVRVGLKNSGR